MPSSGVGGDRADRRLPRRALRHPPDPGGARAQRARRRRADAADTEDQRAARLLGRDSLWAAALSAGRSARGSVLERELRRGNPQVVAEGPVDEALAPCGPDHTALDPGWQPGKEALGAEHPAEPPLVGVDELGVVAERGLPVLAPHEHPAELLAELDPEVEGNADAFGGQRQAVARRVADEEHPVLGAGAQLVGDPVALIADRGTLQLLCQQHGGLLDVEAWIEGADPDPLLVGGGEAPAVARRHVAAVDPDLEVVAGAAGVDLEAPREGGIRGLVAAVGSEDPAPAERVHDQRRRDVAPVGADRLPVTTLHLGGLELGIALLPEQLAELPVVEGGEGPGQLIARGPVRGVDDQLAELLPGGGLQAHRPQPPGRDPAGRGLALADLIAIQDQHPGVGAGELAGDGEAGEARSADDHLEIPRNRRALLAALGEPPWHRPDRSRRSRCTGRAGPCRWLTSAKLSRRGDEPRNSQRGTRGIPTGYAGRGRSRGLG